MRETIAAAAELDDDGISTTVIDLRSLVPLDIGTVIGSVERTGRVVIIHEAPRTAGFGGEVAAQIQERALYSLQAPIERVTGWDTVVPLRKSEGHYIPSVARIVAAARRTMEG